MLDHVKQFIMQTSPSVDRNKDRNELFMYSVDWQCCSRNGLLSSTDEEKKWTGPFCFIQAADPQLGLMKAWRVGDCDRGGDEWAEEVQLTKQAVGAINKLQPRPRFVVLCGDLIHAMPGEITVQEVNIN